MAKQGLDFEASPSSEELGEYPLFVTVYQADGATPRPYAVVKLTNLITGMSANFTADANGYVEIVIGTDLDQGLTLGDRFVIEQVVDDDDMEYFVTTNGNATYPTWVQLEQNTRTRTKLNTMRFKLNTTLYPSGYSVKITKTDA